MKILQKISSIFQRMEDSVRSISRKIGVPKSTVHFHKQKISERISDQGTDFWESDLGRQHIIRLVIGSIYVFSIKGGKGAGLLNEFFELLALDKHTGISQSSILRIIRRVEALILEYRDAMEKKMYDKSDEIKLILGVDETWFDKMYLVCQDLSSGYLLVEEPSIQRDAKTWDESIKKKSIRFCPELKYCIL